MKIFISSSLFILILIQSLQATQIQMRVENHLSKEISMKDIYHEYGGTISSFKTISVNSEGIFKSSSGAKGEGSCSSTWHDFEGDAITSGLLSLRLPDQSVNLLTIFWEVHSTWEIANTIAYYWGPQVPDSSFYNSFITGAVGNFKSSFDTWTTIDLLPNTELSLFLSDSVTDVSAVVSLKRKDFLPSPPVSITHSLTMDVSYNHWHTANLLGNPLIYLAKGQEWDILPRLYPYQSGRFHAVDDANKGINEGVSGLIGFPVSGNQMTQQYLVLFFKVTPETNDANEIAYYYGPDFPDVNLWTAYINNQKGVKWQSKKGWVNWSSLPNDFKIDAMITDSKDALAKINIYKRMHFDENIPVKIITMMDRSVEFIVEVCQDSFGEWPRVWNYGGFDWHKWKIRRVFDNKHIIFSMKKPDAALMIIPLNPLTADINLMPYTNFFDDRFLWEIDCFEVDRACRIKSSVMNLYWSLNPGGYGIATRVRLLPDDNNTFLQRFYIWNA